MTTAERVAARFVLAEMPLWALREQPAIPYEQDEVTRAIQDAVHETVYQEIKGWTVGQLREWLLAEASSDLRQLKKLGWSLRPMKEKGD